MIFLVHYDRTSGKLVSLREFEDSQREEARQVRLEMELELLAQNGSHEVVLLEASSLEILKNTHRRYFDSFEAMRTNPESGS